MTPQILGRPDAVPLSSLLLDVENPRIPDQHRSDDQADLAVLLEMGFEAFAIAQSIADNGYFHSEPLLVVASGNEQWVVVEGNRRLTALMGLAYPEIRSQFAEPERWEGVAAKAQRTPDDRVPVIIHPDRASTHVEVARIHVTGRLPWRPYMQSRFIANRVAEGRTFEEVATLMGIAKSKVADLYRDQAVVQQAQSLGIDTGDVEKAFSVLTVAMGNTKLRNHIGAPLGSRLDPGTEPIPPDKGDELRELLTWVFGGEDAEPVISDSRQMSQLGNIVANEVGLKALRKGLSLEEAKQKVQATGMDPRERLLNRLKTAVNALTAAGEDMAEHAGDPEVEQRLYDVEAAVVSLRSTSDDVVSDSVDE